VTADARAARAKQRGRSLKHPFTRSPFNWLRPPGPVAPGLRIGLLGGSFNPPHEGHFHISAEALKRLGVDYVWWLVTPQNPLKPSAGTAPLHDRISDAAALARHPRIIVMDIERVLGTRYTVDTLRALRRRFPQLRFIWLMGSDSLENFRRWHRWTDIVTQMPVAAFMRPGSVLAALHAKPIQRFARTRRDGRVVARSKPPALAIIEGRRNSQSSTALRAALAQGEAMVSAMPPC
jgi:nicotinate-nucleotide adenylyltransferase